MSENSNTKSQAAPAFHRRAPDYSCDFLVIGSGAAALSAALTAAIGGLKVLVVEKEDKFGGASARSGGCLWIPNARHAAEAGIKDSREAALEFFRNEAGERINLSAVEAFLDTGPEMVEFIEANSPVRFGHLWLPDYHCDTPGGSKQGRGLYPENWDATSLGEDIKRLRPPPKTSTFLTMQVGTHEAAKYYTAARKISSALYLLKRIALRLFDQLRAGRSLQLCAGNALVGGLASAALAKGVQLWTNAGARKLIVENGRVIGAEIETDKGATRVLAKRGVVLATGGFPHDSKRRAELFAAGITAPEVWGMLPYGNSGDGLRMGEAAGGEVNTRMKSPIAMTPMTRMHPGEALLQIMPCFSNRGKPGVIGVTRDGKRFTNEGRSYHDFCAGLLAKEAGEPQAVAWLVFDHRYLRRYGVGPILPAPIPYKQHLKSGYLKKGRTLRELAQVCGIDAEQLEKTVARYNSTAREAIDPDFHRGTNAYDFALGDPDHKPNPCIGPLDRAPFYAIRVFVGAVGTFVGLQSDGHARVLDDSGAPIPGLYVAGNDMASITGGDYIAGGCTLGPGMTFGYIAAKHALASGGESSNGAEKQRQDAPKVSA